MEVTDYQNLQATVEAADVAVRVASQLRQWEAGRPINDAEVLRRAQDFLESASNGSSFIAGHFSHAAFGETLQPLNWATETYLLSAKQSPSGKLDYTALAKYLDQIRTALEAVSKGSRIQKEQAESARRFFDALGELLASRADQRMRRESMDIDFVGGGI